ncbi:ST3 beta-galactoside alpha-2,3-sialyltransferase 3 [Rhinolophus ferrumequinum]|uniref:ST3 beta-galactoside alpha-2,3-sialyltransferase 3 n=1 Tax=Rhinolophus ferrumequinum TaxID=59479 RepID=A0A7J7X7U3_RHIFE|nr:ST3 beta-galactoside alpha-2,3-sialyltransferase 3 [Rhinolophus ferrumequinum]
MGLLVFVRNLLLALCLFLVLGFLYYSAWKLHLLQWEDSKYDRLGFLLKLDSKLPAELATKYANFSEGACKPGYASALMTAIFPRQFDQSHLVSHQRVPPDPCLGQPQLPPLHHRGQWRCPCQQVPGVTN